MGSGCAVKKSMINPQNGLPEERASKKALQLVVRLFPVDNIAAKRAIARKQPEAIDLQ